jgi:hypothetical protein
MTKSIVAALALLAALGTASAAEPVQTAKEQPVLLTPKQLDTITAGDGASADWTGVPFIAAPPTQLVCSGGSCFWVPQ